MYFFGRAKPTTVRRLRMCAQANVVPGVRFLCAVPLRLAWLVWPHGMVRFVLKVTNRSPASLVHVAGFCLWLSACMKVRAVQRIQCPMRYATQLSQHLFVVAIVMERLLDSSCHGVATRGQPAGR